MNKNLSLFIKGIVLGIAFIIPGVSGGTLAVLLGIYEELLDKASNFYKSFKNFKSAFKFLFPILFGVLVSIAVCVKIIKLGLDKAPIVTLLIFVGLIIGGIPKLFKNAPKKASTKEISYMMIGIVVVLVMAILDKSRGSVSFDNMQILGYLLLFIVGIIASATMVIPGISGSFTLMLIGYYEPIVSVVNNIVAFKDLRLNLLIILPFLIGVVIGIVLISKMINYLLKKYPVSVYYIILGFVLSSIFSVFYQVFSYNFVLSHFIIGIILMVLNSILVSKLFND